jgi:hypothetical protein
MSSSWWRRWLSCPRRHWLCERVGRWSRQARPYVGVGCVASLAPQGYRAVTDVLPQPGQPSTTQPRPTTTIFTGDSLRRPRSLTPARAPRKPQSRRRDRAKVDTTNPNRGSLLITSPQRAGPARPRAIHSRRDLGLALLPARSDTRIRPKQLHEEPDAVFLQHALERLQRRASLAPAEQLKGPCHLDRLGQLDARRLETEPAQPPDARRGIRLSRCVARRRDGQPGLPLPPTR